LVRRFVIGSGCLLGAATFFFAGCLIVRVDPPVHADAIYVLGGSRVDRWLEAVELYKAGHAPLILLSPGGQESGQRLLAARGIRVPSEVDIARDVMVGQMGLPAAAVEVLPGAVDNTAHEAEAIAGRARAGGWRTLIIVTSRPATRRAGYAFERVLGDGVQVVVRDARFDDFNGTWWWTDRAWFRSTFYEFPKLVAYWLGLGA
jgi:uncharacterized SAM-binding protein YcdF (DUF218 family)